jgi:hypothetical protein
MPSNPPQGITSMWGQTATASHSWIAPATVYSAPLHAASNINVGGYTLSYEMLKFGELTCSLDQALNLFTSKIIDRNEIRYAIAESKISISNHVCDLVNLGIFTPDEARSAIGLKAVDWEPEEEPDGTD